MMQIVRELSRIRFSIRLYARMVLSWKKIFAKSVHRTAKHAQLEILAKNARITSYLKQNNAPVLKTFCQLIV
jgi:hypothetical protein